MLCDLSGFPLASTYLGLKLCSHVANVCTRGVGGVVCLVVIMVSKLTILVVKAVAVPSILFLPIPNHQNIPEVMEESTGVLFSSGR